MLSKMHLIILGIISESPINPYSIKKLLEKLMLRDWFPYADSSIYAAVKTLEKRGFITGEAEKTGNNPEKSVFSITPGGNKVFLENLRKFIMDSSADYQLLDAAILFLCHLPKEELLSLLVKRELVQIKIKNELSRQIKSMRENPRFPGTFRINIEHALLINLAHLETLKRLRMEIQKMESWDFNVTSLV